MVRLCVVERSSALLRQSAEFRFLARWRASEIAAAFEGVELEHLDAGLETLRSCAGQYDWVLVLEPEVFIGRRTLQTLMRWLAQDQATWAAPRLLSEWLQDGARVHTLRAFERLEQLGLAEPPREARRALPVSLWKGKLLAEGLERASSFEALPGSVGWGLEAGLAHRFERYYGQLRSDVAPILPAAFHHVLEIGCGEGQTGAWLEQTFGCRVTGLELNPVAAEAARSRLSRIWVGDVEHLKIDEKFDLILALELFEHLVDPFCFLDRVGEWLHPGGTLLMSVPNIGAAPLVEDLLAGRFDYIPVGLLCVTHLRFFTRSSLEVLLTRYGFREIECWPQPGGDARRLLAAAQAAGLDVDPASLEALGYWVRARR